MAVYLKGITIALKGLPTTLYVALFALVIGALFGFLLANMRLSNVKIAKIVSSVYIEVFRSTPMIVQALIFAYGIPMLLQSNGINFKWPVLIIPAMLVCGLNSAAYMAEVMRAGIQAVDPGQVEAAYSLGMSKGKVKRLIIIPQAFRIVLPSLCNELVTLIKETSVLAYVGVVEVLRSAQLWNASTFETFPAYIGAAVVYFVVCFTLSKLVGKLEKKLKGDTKDDEKKEEK